MDIVLLICLLIAFIIVIFTLGYTIYQKYHIIRQITGPTGPPGTNVTPPMISNFSFDLGVAGVSATDVNINVSTNQHLYLQNSFRPLNINLQSAVPGNLIYITNVGSQTAQICTSCSDGSNNCQNICPENTNALWTFIGGNNDPLSYQLESNSSIGIYILPNQKVILDRDFP